MKWKGRRGGVRLNGRRIWSDIVQDDDNRADAGIERNGGKKDEGEDEEKMDCLSLKR